MWNQLSILLGTKLHHTTAFHPQANGMVERFHRDLKAALRARLKGPNWADQLPWVLLGLRTAPREDLNASSAELVFGAALTVPGDFIAPPSDAVAAAEFLRNLRRGSRPSATNACFAPWSNILVHAKALERCQLCVRPSRQPQRCSAACL